MCSSNIYQVKKVTNPHDIETRVPGSKSITNRALLIAALAEGTSVLRGVLFSDDSRHFMQALYDLGFPIYTDEEEETVTIEGFGVAGQLQPGLAPRKSIGKPCSNVVKVIAGG